MSKQATPHAELIAELMNPNNPKNEREHAAVREIEEVRKERDALSTKVDEVEAVNAYLLSVNYSVAIQNKTLRDALSVAVDTMNRLRYDNNSAMAEEKYHEAQDAARAALQGANHEPT